MPKFRCCRQTFTSNSALKEHTALHTSKLGSNIDSVGRSNQEEKDTISSEMHTGSASMSISSQKNKNPTEAEANEDRTAEETIEWKAIMETLITERSRIMPSQADSKYWDLAVQTLVSVKSRYQGEDRSERKNRTMPPAPAYTPIISVEEHKLVLQNLADATKERDEWKTKWEANEAKITVLELVEKQYKRMLSLRTKEIYQVKTMAVESLPTENLRAA